MARQERVSDAEMMVGKVLVLEHVDVVVKTASVVYCVVVDVTNLVVSVPVLVVVVVVVVAVVAPVVVVVPVVVVTVVVVPVVVLEVVVVLLSPVAIFCKSYVGTLSPYAILSKSASSGSNRFNCSAVVTGLPNSSKGCLGSLQLNQLCVPSPQYS